MNLGLSRPNLLPSGDATKAMARSAALGVFLAVAFGTSQLWAQNRVPAGTLVRVKLHYDLTTENVEKGDRLEFDVVDDVVVDGRVVIRAGAAAWGRVLEVKGAGKKRAKNAEVQFRFETVRSVDNQEIPIRVLSTKPRKKDARENSVTVNTPIPGLLERIVGAPKGKEYAAYTDADVLVRGVEPQPKAPVAAATPATPPAAAAADAPPPVEEEARVDFNSVPDGAEIVIDGEFRGMTPSRLPVRAGRRAVEVRLAGHRTWTRTMVVDPGSRPSIRVVLEK